MRIFGLEITRIKAAPPNLTPPDSRGGWYPIIKEPFTGAWQRNVEVRVDTALTFSAVYACVSLIASDIGKIGIRLVQKDEDGIWVETENPAYSPVLRKPNQYQNRIKFIEQWITSKLINGNAYVLKGRDNRGVVTDLYVLDPQRVKTLVSPDGAVFYELRKDNLSGLTEDSVTVPASEIIHDLMVALYHPLCGVSPITACGLAAIQGLRIQENSAQFFGNGSNPGGILTAPGRIDEETAKRIKAQWEQNYSGANVGRVAVLGDGLNYQKMAITAVDAQLIDQLKWSKEDVASCFHVPAYMIGAGAPLLNNNVESLNQAYYSQCLQALIESLEVCLDEGLGLSKDIGVELDLDNLLRMDTGAKVKAAAEGIGAGLFSPNEKRKDFDLPPVNGGDTPYLQQQNFSLAALNKRDASADPFGTAPPPAAPASPPAPPAPKAMIVDLGRHFYESFERSADARTA